MNRWGTFHDNFPDTNSNKIAQNNRGIVLQSNHFGRACDICDLISDEIIQSTKDVDAILGAIHKYDPLTVVSNLFGELIQLISTKRSSNETFRNFESRFNAQLSRFNALSQSTMFPNAISAFSLLANANVDTAQRISILAAASPSSTTADDEATTDSLPNMVSYESVATVLRQCDQASEQTSSHLYNVANAALFPSPAWNRKPSSHFMRHRRTPEQVQEAKNVNPCVRCGKYGHCYGDHRHN